MSEPSLTIAGCAPGQDTVAAFVASLKEIDGVTRVGLESSTRRSAKAKATRVERTGCHADGQSASFRSRVAFDEAPSSMDAG